MLTLSLLNEDQEMSHESTLSHSTSSEKMIAVNGSTYGCPFVDLLPSLHPEEREALVADIRRRGVVVPVVVDEDNNVIDGHNRLQIAAELQLADVPVEVKAGLSPDQRRDLALNLNLQRRHLTREQRRDLIARALKADPARSNNQIATETKSTDKTVAAARARLESTSEIPKLDRTTGKDGRTRRAQRRKPRATTPVARDLDQRTPAAPRPSPADTAPTEAAAPAPTPALEHWPDLKRFAQDLKWISEDIRKLAKTKVADRTPEPVRAQLARLRERLDKMETLFAVA
jgi:site-specific DNA-methyltransferase (adenine-specific)